MLNIKPRKFHQVVSDLRAVTFSVIRDRRHPKGMVYSTPIGTGFFVRHDLLISCEHVFHGPSAPHQPGDSYRLIAKLSETETVEYIVPSPELGKELLLFSEYDLAVLRVPTAIDQEFVSLCYDDALVGEDVGSVGYPQAFGGGYRKAAFAAREVMTRRAYYVDKGSSENVAEKDAFEDLIFRAGRGVITGRFSADPHGKGKAMPILEVDVIFASGSSGAPLFDPATGKVFGMVQRLQWFKIAEQVTQISVRPGQLPVPIVAPVVAVHSWAVKVDCFKAALDGLS